MTSPLLSDSTVAFIEREVAIDVAACSASLRPSSARGFAARVSEDRRRITVFVRRTEATQLVQDLLSQDAIAAVFCLPATEMAIQVKGRQVTLSAANADEWARVQAYRLAFVDGIVQLGYDRDFGLTYMAVEPGQMLAVGFTPEIVFEQTPGPLAGRAMHGGEGRP